MSTPAISARSTCAPSIGGLTALPSISICLEPGEVNKLAPPAGERTLNDFERPLERTGSVSHCLQVAQRGPDEPRILSVRVHCSLLCLQAPDWDATVCSYSRFAGQPSPSTAALLQLTRICICTDVCWTPRVLGVRIRNDSVASATCGYGYEIGTASCIYTVAIQKISAGSNST